MSVEFVGLQGTGRPEWEVSAGIDENREVYVPYFVTNEKEKHLFLMAAHDGIAIAVLDEHPFFPMSWIIENFCKSEEEKSELERFRNNILRHKDSMTS